MTIFRNLLEAQMHGDLDSVTRTSIILAFDRIASSGAQHYGIILPTAGERSQRKLHRHLKSIQCGKVLLDLIWNNPVNDEELMERAILVPCTEDCHFSIATRHIAEIVKFVDLGSPDFFKEHLHSLRPNRILKRAIFRPQAFIEALAASTLRKGDN